MRGSTVPQSFLRYRLSGSSIPLSRKASDNADKTDMAADLVSGKPALRLQPRSAFSRPAACVNYG